MILLLQTVLLIAAAGQEKPTDPDAWLNRELRRDLGRPPRLWTHTPEERDLRASGDLLGIPGTVNDALANDQIRAVSELIRDPGKLLDFRVRTYSPELPHPYEERFRELHEKFQREERRD